VDSEPSESVKAKGSMSCSKEYYSVLVLSSESKSLWSKESNDRSREGSRNMDSEPFHDNTSKESKTMDVSRTHDSNTKEEFGSRKVVTDFLEEYFSGWNKGQSARVSHLKSDCYRKEMSASHRHSLDANLLSGLSTSMVYMLSGVLFEQRLISREEYEELMLNHTNTKLMADKLLVCMEHLSGDQYLQLVKKIQNIEDAGELRHVGKIMLQAAGKYTKAITWSVHG
jgi:hypothetical protein